MEEGGIYRRRGRQRFPRPTRAWTDDAPTGPSPYGASAFPLRPSDYTSTCYDGRLQRHRANDVYRMHSGDLEPARVFP